MTESKSRAYFELVKLAPISMTTKLEVTSSSISLSFKSEICWVTLSVGGPVPEVTDAPPFSAIWLQPGWKWVAKWDTRKLPNDRRTQGNLKGSTKEHMVPATVAFTYHPLHKQLQWPIVNISQRTFRVHSPLTHSNLINLFTYLRLNSFNCNNYKYLHKAVEINVCNQWGNNWHACYRSVADRTDENWSTGSSLSDNRGSNPFLVVCRVSCRS